MSILKVNTIQDKGGNAIISSDGSGTLTPNSALATGVLANTPAFLAYQSSNQGINDNAYSIIQANTEVYDTDNAYNNSTYTFTVPSGKAGKYIFFFFFELENSNKFREALVGF